MTIPNIVTFCHSAFALSLTYQAMNFDRKASAVMDFITGYMLETGNTDLLETCHGFQGELDLLQGRIARADYRLRNYSDVPPAQSFIFYTPQLTQPKILLAKKTKKSLAAAHQALLRLSDYYTSINNIRVLIDVSLLQVMLHFHQGDISAASERLARVMTLAEPGGLIRPFLDSGSEMKALLTRFIEQNPAHHYAGKILAAFASNETKTVHSPVDHAKKSPSTEEQKKLVQPLTNREIEVLRTLKEGISNNEIASRLFISPETVKRHLSTIYRKLEVKNRQQALNRARSMGIL